MKTALPMTNISFFPEKDPRHFSTTLKSLSGFDAVEINYIPGIDPILVSVSAFNIHKHDSHFITKLVEGDPVILSEINEAIAGNEEMIREAESEVFTDDAYDEIILEDFS